MLDLYLLDQMDDRLVQSWPLDWQNNSLVAVDFNLQRNYQACCLSLSKAARASKATRASTGSALERLSSYSTAKYKDHFTENEPCRVF